MRRTPEDIANIEYYMKKTVLAENNPEELANYEMEFHRAITCAAHNSMLTQVYASIADMSFQYILLVRKLQNLMQVNTEHRSIFEAIRDNKPEVARKEADDHIANTFRQLGED